MQDHTAKPRVGCAISERGCRRWARRHRASIPESLALLSAAPQALPPRASPAEANRHPETGASRPLPSIASGPLEHPREDVSRSPIRGARGEPGLEQLDRGVQIEPHSRFGCDVQSGFEQPEGFAFPSHAEQHGTQIDFQLRVRADQRRRPEKEPAGIVEPLRLAVNLGVERASGPVCRIEAHGLFQWIRRGSRLPTCHSADPR